MGKYLQKPECMKKFDLEFMRKLDSENAADVLALFKYEHDRKSISKKAGTKPASLTYKAFESYRLLDKSERTDYELIARDLKRRVRYTGLDRGIAEKILISTLENLLSCKDGNKKRYIGAVEHVLSDEAFENVPFAKDMSHPERWHDRFLIAESIIAHPSDLKYDPSKVLSMFEAAKKHAEYSYVNNKREWFRGEGIPEGQLPLKLETAIKGYFTTQKRITAIFTGEFSGFTEEILKVI